MKLPKTKRGWAGLGCGSILVLLVLCSALGAATGNRTQDTAQQVAPAAASEATEAPAATAAPAATEAPTDVPPTAEPTAIPPTVEPTAEPTPVPPQEFTGTGQVVQDVQIDALSTLAFTHNGSRNFQVWAYGADDQKDLLVNTIGDYQGVRWLEPGAYTLEIDADGAWTMAIAAMGLDQSATGAMQGAGDFVSGVFQSERGRAAYTFVHEGERNFQVWLLCESNRDLLINEIGAIQAEAVVSTGGELCFWQVDADGAWTVAPK